LSFTTLLPLDGPSELEETALERYGTTSAEPLDPREILLNR
jgi:hypothetical protein